MCGRRVQAAAVVVETGRGAKRKNVRGLPGEHALWAGELKKSSAARTADRAGGGSGTEAEARVATISGWSQCGLEHEITVDKIMKEWLGRAFDAESFDVRKTNL
jgi:hypothetical protein